MAFLTVAVWGSTFVFTKMLLQDGLSPAQIFTLRFLIAYVLLAVFSLFTRNHRWFAGSWADEAMMVVLGITGGSAYFMAENAALLFTTATNTSLIVCSCPLFTMFLVAMVYRHSEHFSYTQIAGSLTACAGMAVVVLNGHFVLHLSPLGDLLAFAACLSWAVYSLLMKRISLRYSPLFITRKVFIYGLLTILPYYLLQPREAFIFTPSVLHLFSTQTLLNLLFLGCIASMACFLTWSWVIWRLGAVLATNWVYFNPVTTIFFAWWLLDEQITPWFLLGATLILLGMFLSDRTMPQSAQGT